MPMGRPRSSSSLAGVPPLFYHENTVCGGHIVLGSGASVSAAWLIGQESPIRGSTVHSSASLAHPASSAAAS
jgi:hypothetical protein